MDKCPICGRTMLPNVLGSVGDPAWVCPTDDKAHRDAADVFVESTKSEIAAQAAQPDPEEIARLGARWRVT